MSKPINLNDPSLPPEVRDFLAEADICSESSRMEGDGFLLLEEAESYWGSLDNFQAQLRGHFNLFADFDEEVLLELSRNTPDPFGDVYFLPPFLAALEKDAVSKEPAIYSLDHEGAPSQPEVSPWIGFTENLPLWIGAALMIPAFFASRNGNPAGAAAAEAMYLSAQQVFARCLDPIRVPPDLIRPAPRASISVGRGPSLEGDFPLVVRGVETERSAGSLRTGATTGTRIIPRAMPGSTTRATPEPIDDTAGPPIFIHDVTPPSPPLNLRGDWGELSATRISPAQRPIAPPLPPFPPSMDDNDIAILPGADDGQEMDLPTPDKDLVFDAPAALVNEVADFPSAEEFPDEPVGDPGLSSDYQYWLKNRRPYQKEAVQAVLDHWRRGGDRGLVVLPTGTGKTFTFVETLWELSRLPAFRGKKILVVAHQDQIVSQNAVALGDRFGVGKVGMVQGQTQEWNNPVVSASVQTLANHLNEVPWDEFGLLVLDEAHHYVEGNEWFEIAQRMGFFDAEGNPVDQSGEKILLGYTATPDRLSGKPLVTVYGPNLLYTRDINFFIQGDYLLKPYGISVTLTGTDDQRRPLLSEKVWALLTLDQKAQLLADIFYTNPKLHYGDAFKKTAVFLTSREEVEGLETRLRDDYGINAVGVLDDTPDRTQKLNDFKAGKYDFLLNIDIATEGFDDPGIEAVVLARPTESRSKVVQQVGRALRVDPAHPERKEALIVDLMGNLEKHDINIRAEEAYQWGKESQGLTREEGLRDEKRIYHPVVSLHWQAVDLGRFVTVDNLFRLKIKSLLTAEEQVTEISYRAGLNSDKVMQWWLGSALPETEKEVKKLEASLNIKDEGLLVAYQETVGGAIRSYLIQRLKEKAQGLGRTPIATELGGNYPSTLTYQRYFGTFNNALRAAGLEVTRTKFTGELTREGAIEILNEAAGELEAQRKTMTGHNFEALRKAAHPDWPSVPTICRAITGNKKDWNGSLRAAGLEVTRTQGELTRERAIEILQTAVGELEGQEKKISVSNFEALRKAAHPDWPSVQTICRAITGSITDWNGSLRAAGLEVIHAVGELTPKGAIEILKEAAGELEAQRKTMTEHNFEALRKAAHPDWPSIQTICKAITGSITDWNGSLRVAGLAFRPGKRPDPSLIGGKGDAGYDEPIQVSPWNEKDPGGEFSSPDKAVLDGDKAADGPGDTELAAKFDLLASGMKDDIEWSERELDALNSRGANLSEADKEWKKREESTLDRARKRLSSLEKARTFYERGEFGPARTCLLALLKAAKEGEAEDLLSLAARLPGGIGLPDWKEWHEWGRILLEIKCRDLEGQSHVPLGPVSDRRALRHKLWLETKSPESKTLRRRHEKLLSAYDRLGRKQTPEAAREFWKNFSGCFRGPPALDFFVRLCELIQDNSVVEDESAVEDQSADAPSALYAEKFQEIRVLIERDFETPKKRSRGKSPKTIALEALKSASDKLDNGNLKGALRDLNKVIKEARDQTAYMVQDRVEKLADLLRKAGG
ncbi:MAG: DEAD/DEAH box helicase family protein [Deltaproteobacteria bacterium]|nr:DEAD/DEAH box helicase family protein [Deltaproteobacteria bacterium]